MKKILYLLVSLGALLAVSCEKEPGGGEASLAVEKSSLTFAATGAEPQTVGVTASGVQWEIQISETLKEWITVDKTDDKTLTVTVKDNPKPEQRTGSFTVKPVGNDDVKSKSISVVQEAAKVEYKFAVNPSSLKFDAEGAPSQEVTVTAEGGFTWTAVPEEDVASWITVTPKEGKFEVKVADNPDGVEREGNIVVTPSEESVGKKAIRVKQAARYFPPSLTIDVEDPAAGLAFHRNGQAKDKSQIQVTAVNCPNWDARAVDADNQAVTWLTVGVGKSDGLSSVSLTLSPNTEFTERVAYVVITAGVEDVAEIRVKITQDAAQEHHSTLTGDVDVSNFAHAYGFVSPNQDWEDPALASGWTIRFWTDGVEHDLNKYEYTGTGARMEIDFAAEHMKFNYDEVYTLPEGVYTVAPAKKDGVRLDPLHVTAGYPGYFDYQHFASWWIGLENSNETQIAPIAEGTITVAKAGEDRYTFTFDCVDDLGFKITGSYTVDVPYRQQGTPVGPPPPTDPLPGSLK